MQLGYAVWLANNGTGNFYMTAFDCKITNVAADATPIAPPQNPVWCDKTDTACMAKRKGGSKRPLYAYNSDSNVSFASQPFAGVREPVSNSSHHSQIVWKGNYDRPGYHANWGFPIDGAQTDICELRRKVAMLNPSLTPQPGPQSCPLLL